MNQRVAVMLLALFFLFALVPLAESANTPTELIPIISGSPVQAIAVAPNTNIYAGTFGSGIFRSVDNGETWADRNAELTDKDVFALVTNSHGTIFAGTFGGGVYRSSDDAAHWVQVNNGLGCTEIISLEAGHDGCLYAGTSNDGVYFSLNDGDSWTHSGLRDTYVSTIAANSNGDVFAGTSHGIYRSVDGRSTWTLENTGLTCKDVWAIAVHPAGDLFAATNGCGVYRSADNGTTCSQANTGLTSKNVGSLAICHSGDIFAGTTRGVSRSTDNGVSWVNVEGDLPIEAVRCLTVNGDGQIVAGTIKGGVFRSKSLAPIPENPGENLSASEQH